MAVLRLQTESLTGPDAQCSFEYVGNAEPFRCSVRTKAAITAESFMRIRFTTRDNVIIHGRAMCSQHIDYLTDFAV